MSKVVKGIYDAAKASKEADGAAVMKSKDVAKLVKAKLASAFAGVKFSVTSDYHSVDVSWTDGPPSNAVDKIIKQYSFGGFDGMIDMAYSSKNWLLPDGSMKPASCEGTQGSMGYVPAYATDCPMAGAVLVKYGPKYVHGHHSHSDEKLAELCELAAKKYGYEIDHSVPLHRHHVDSEGEYLTTLAWRMERELWDATEVSVG